MNDLSMEEITKHLVNSIRSSSLAKLTGTDNVSLDEWFKDYELHARSQGWTSPKQKGNRLYLYVQGLAQSIYRDQPTATQNNYDDMKEVLIKELPSVDRCVQMRLKLKALTFGVDQRAATFNANFNRAVRLLEEAKKARIEREEKNDDEDNSQDESEEDEVDDSSKMSKNEVIQIYLAKLPAYYEDKARTFRLMSSKKCKLQDLQDYVLRVEESLADHCANSNITRYPFKGIPC